MDRQNRESMASMKWLSSKWTQSKECPICGATHWGLGEDFEIRQFENNANPYTVSGNMYLRLSPVCCRECGYTFFMNVLSRNNEDGPLHGN